MNDYLVSSTFKRLHHDQQTALESAAAAYSNYPISGMQQILKFFFLNIIL